MKSSLSPADVTPAVKSAASAVLMARAYAQSMRKQVNAIETAILAECPLFVADIKSDAPTPERITDPAYVWMTDLDSPQYHEHLAETNRRLRAAGLKPDDMADAHCPALIAESIQRDAVHILIHAAAEMMDTGSGNDFCHKLLCSGMPKYCYFVDLLCKLVVNLPDFRNPLTGKTVR
jgi:hypothetical protein